MKKAVRCLLEFRQNSELDSVAHRLWVGTWVALDHSGVGLLALLADLVLVISVLSTAAAIAATAATVAAPSVLGEQ